MKKRTAYLLLFSLVFALLTGCSAEPETSSSEETLAPTEGPTDEEGNSLGQDGREPSSDESSTEETQSEKIGLTALAQVPNYVNVRKGPSTEDEIIGKIFNNCAAEILDEVKGEDGNWYLMTSGNVKGYIKSEFFVVGEEAEQMRNEVGVLRGVVDVDYLRVRSSPSLENLDNVMTHYQRGTEVYISEMTEDGWAKIEADDASAGYVFGECMIIEKVFKKAMTLAEEEEMIAKKEAAEKAAKEAEEAYQKALLAEEERKKQEAEWQKQWQQQQWQQQQQTAAPPAYDPSTDSKAALRNAVVAYALQFVGNPYVHAGRSLVTGTDCSGFTHLVYEHFGYSLYWDPPGQSTQYVKITDGNLLPGDLIFYDNDIRPLGHVALYIGNGQIVHAANERLGILVAQYNYRPYRWAVRVIN